MSFFVANKDDELIPGNVYKGFKVDENENPIRGDDGNAEKEMLGTFFESRDPQKAPDGNSYFVYTFIDFSSKDEDSNYKIMANVRVIKPVSVQGMTKKEYYGFEETEYPVGTPDIFKQCSTGGKSKRRTRKSHRKTHKKQHRHCSHKRHPRAKPVRRTRR